MKPTLCIDYNSVVLSAPGAISFIAAAVEHFNVDIVSARSSEPIVRRAMWSHVHDELEKTIGGHEASRISSLIDFPESKPTKCVILDGRALIDGTLPSIEALLALTEPG